MTNRDELIERATSLVAKYDEAMASHEGSQSDIKLAVMSNYGDLALSLLRSIALLRADDKRYRDELIERSLLLAMNWLPSDRGQEGAGALKKVEAAIKDAIALLRVEQDTKSTGQKLADRATQGSPVDEQSSETGPVAPHMERAVDLAEEALWAGLDLSNHTAGGVRSVARRIVEHLAAAPFLRVPEGWAGRAETLLASYDKATACQDSGEAKLMAMANYGDLAIDTLRSMLAAVQMYATARRTGP